MMAYCHNTKFSIKSFVMIQLAALYYLFQFVLRVSPNVMSEYLIRDFSTDATAIGIFTSCYYISYIIFLIPSGILMDVFGPKRVMILGGVICSLGCFIMGVSEKLSIAYFGRLCIGMGSCVGYLGTLKVGTNLVAPKHYGKIVAFTISAGLLGGIIGGAPLEMSCTHLGWRYSFFLLGSIGMSLTVLFIFFLEDSTSSSKYLGSFIECLNLMLQNLLNIICKPQIWIISFYSMLMYMPLVTFGDMLGVGFIKKSVPNTDIPASSILAWMLIGIFFGNFFFVGLSEYFKSYKKPIIIGCFTCLLLFSVIIYLRTESLVTLSILFFLSGFSFGAKSLGFSSILASVSEDKNSTAIAFANTIIMLSGVVFLPLLGYLIDYSKQNYSLSSYHTEYSLFDYQFALSLVPLSILLAFMFSLKIKEAFVSQSFKAS